MAVTVSDNNTVEVTNASADATFDVDVDPVNNFAFVLTLPEGNEQVIDDAGGIWQIPFIPEILDTDGSETITAVVLRGIPTGITVYVENPDDPTGEKIPALLTEVNNPQGFNDWSLENEGWLSAELRGIPTHFAGDYPIQFDVVTTEFDGGNTRVTTLNEILTVDPVVDGGDPSETAQTNEDTAVNVPITGNIIDNIMNSPVSPEDILGEILISNVQPDSFGRVPEFFTSEPDENGFLPISGLRQLNLSDAFDLRLSASEAENLWLIPGQDSNEDVVFDVTVVYFETLDPSQFQANTGTVTVEVTGIADEPIVTIQNPDPTDDPDATLTDEQINDIFRPDEVTDSVANADRVYGYAGTDQGPFRLNMRLSDGTLQSGDFEQDDLFVDADPITGTMTEITNESGAFDGSETIYYVITGLDPSVSILGSSPVDGSGGSYVVTESQLDSIKLCRPLFLRSRITISKSIRS